jgi:hypothetical protein
MSHRSVSLRSDAETPGALINRRPPLHRCNETTMVLAVTPPQSKTQSEREVPPASTAAEYALLVILIGVFLWRGFLPGWKKLNSDFPNYYLAGRLYRQGYPLDRVYEWIWFQRQKDHAGIDQPLVEYLPNTLFLALVVSPLSRLSALEAKRCWLAFNLALLLLTMWLLRRITALSSRRVAILLFLAVIPLRSNFLLGQYHVVMLFLLTAALYLYLKGRPAGSGFVLALATALKIYPGLFVLFFLRKKQWRATLGLVAGSSCFGLAHLFLFGFGPTRTLILEVLPRALRGEEIDPYSVGWNSLTALLRRLFIAEPELNPMPLAHIPGLYAVLQPLLSALPLVLFLWFARSPRVKAEEEKFQWGSFVALLLLLSPHPASYQFCALALTAVVVTDCLLKVHLRRRAMATVVLYALVCLPLQHFSPASPSGWRTLVAFPRLYAMLLLCFLLLWTARYLSGQSWAERLGSREFALAGLAFMILAGGGAWGNFRHFKRQFANYSRRLLVTPGSLLASEPAMMADHGAVFTTMSSRNYVTARLEGDSVTQLAVSEDAFHPVVSSGSNTLWVELASSESRIVRFALADIMSRQPMTVTAGEQPVISGDGKWLAFIRETQGRGSLWVRDIAPGGTGTPSSGIERQLSGSGLDVLDVLDVTFGVDDSVIFSAQGKAGVPELFATSVHASTPHLESYLSGPVRFPAVSPDGKWLAFTRRETTTWQLWLLRIGTRESRRLTDADCNSVAPAWFPDSRRLVYATDCGRGLGLTALCSMQAVP